MGDGVVPSLAELVALRALAQGRRPPRRGQHGVQGHALSNLRGRGMEYAESREYAAGDDARHIDWRLTARSGKAHTKLFQAERERLTLVVADTAPALYFGTRVRFKSVQAARAAAAAAWYAVRAGERVGVMAFGHADQLLRPQAGPRGALAVCGALAEWDAQPVSARVEPLSDALARAGRVLHGASRVLLVSDGFSCDAAARQRLLDLGRHAGISVLAVADALERALPPPGRYPLEHAGERFEVLLQSERQRGDFQRALGAGAARLVELAQSLGLRCSSIDTAADAFEAVSGLLGVRKAAR